ncbi:hypothetical protein [Nonomuraea insulae]|uniref:Cytochrome P450 n=1 Tax=Nonomuraea insulae TaxID=1616787 RepID=A0ABW1D0L4_9ACTN
MTRPGTGHLAFGSGVHVCAGAAIARLEAETLLKALASRIRTLTPAGPPVHRPHNVLRAMAHLPLRATPSGTGPSL